MEVAASVLPYITPLAAFLEPSKCTLLKILELEAGKNWAAAAQEQEWIDFLLNPETGADKPGVSGLEWRIDGCGHHGTRFSALPVFMLPNLPILRIDVYIPDQARHPPVLQRSSKAARTFYIQSHCVNELDISRLVLQALNRWSASQPSFDRAMPFGTRVAIENIVADFDKIELRFLPNVQIDQQLLSTKQLQKMWSFSQLSLPPTIDITRLQHIRQHLRLCSWASSSH